jgi:hypothetical protein
MRRTLSLLLASGLAASILIGPSAVPAQAVVHCYYNDLLYTLEVQAVPNYNCVTYTRDRGFRGFFEFRPIHDFWLAGRLHVELTRNGVHKANSVEHVNPNLPACPTWDDTCVPYYIRTPWVAGKSGTWCSILWDERAPGLYERIDRFCATLP